MPEPMVAVVLALILLFGVAVAMLRLVGLGKTEGPAFIEEPLSTETEKRAV